jgi:aspartyl-tRNA(Asn)/glutamyl-tRNA(Gln) amidotransferase subunit A
MSDPCYLSIAEASDLIRQRKLSPLDLARAHLARIRRLDGTLRSYITVTEELALREAKAAAEEIARGKYRGRLHGIPINYKDIVATAGIRTTNGSRVFADNTPARDAHVVGLLKKAGVVTLGKASTMEFAWAGTTERDFVKPARNPWNTKYSPGGSSTGSAASVAAGLAMGSVASDSGGSIRNPATRCGLSGLKPTFGLVGRSGVFPLSYSCDTVGPLARSALDAAILLDSIVGFDPADGSSTRRSAPQPDRVASRGIRGLRIGILRRYLEACGADAEVFAAFEEAVKVFPKLGAVMTDVDVPHLLYSRAANWTILRIEGFHTHFKRLRDQREMLGADFVRATVPGGFLSSQDYLRAQQARRLISQELGKVFRETDILLCPTNPRTPSPPRYDREPSGPQFARSGEAYVTPFNLNGSPAISIPCGFNHESMPVGLQIAGRPFEDETVLAAAHAYQTATGWHLKRPSTG